MTDMTIDEIRDWIPTLTNTEARIVLALKQGGTWVTPADLRRAANGRPYASSNLPSVHICYIRRKLPATHEILTVRGRGYRLVERANG